MEQRSTAARQQAQAQQQQASKQAARDPHRALARLEEIVRADPDPTVARQALDELLAAGELKPADLPAVEAMLAGIVAPPKPRPKRFYDLPPAIQTKWDERILRDVQRLKEKAQEWYVSEADEQVICALVEHWVAADEQGAFGGTLMDRFILRATGDLYTKGLLSVTTNATDELKRRMTDKGRQRLVAALAKGKALGKLADDAPPELPSVWRDVVVKTAVGLPGGAVFADSGNGVASLFFAPSFNQAGVYPVSFIASDGVDADTQTVQLTVNEVGNPRLFVRARQPDVAGGPYRLDCLCSGLLTTRRLDQPQTRNALLQMVYDCVSVRLRLYELSNSFRVASGQSHNCLACIRERHPSPGLREQVVVGA